MKQRLIKIATVACALALLLSCIGITGQAKKGEPSLEKVDLSAQSATLSSEMLTLSVDADDGDVVVTDKRNGKVYTSTSEKALENEWVVGPSRLAFLSQIGINIIDELGALTTVYSYNGSVKEDGFTLYKSDSVICAQYIFVNEGIRVCVEYRLDGDRLVVDVPTDKIAVRGKYKLADITLLPFFGAATPEDDGDLLIPSGSGALIEFNNGKGKYGEFSQKVYGNDAMDLMNYRTEQGELILFPMYAMMFENGNAAFMAYAENGAALATLKAKAADAESALTTAYFSFNYHPYTLVNPLNTDSQSVKYNQLTRDKAKIDNFSLSYKFFGESQSYFGIAQAVRQKLTDSGVTAAEDALKNKLYLEMFMGVNKTVYTAGFPHKTCYPLTTLEDATQIADDFSDMPIVMIMKGTDSDGAYGGKIDTSFSINSKIGSKKEYSALAEKLASNGGTLYSVANHNEYTKSSFGFSKLFHAARSVTGKNIKLYRYRYGDGQQDAEIEALNLLNYSKMLKGVNKFIKSAKKNGVSAVAPLSISNSPYTCNNAGGDRNRVYSTYKEALKAYNSADINLLLEAPTDELVTYADNIYALPIKSGRHKIFDEDIPFIQLVLNGLRNYSTPALNEEYGKQLLLKALESGSSPALSLYASEYDDIYDTPLRDYVSSEYSVQKESLSALISEYRLVADELKDSQIIGHTVLSNNVHAASYSNSKTVIVNFTGTDYNHNGKQVAANSYLVIKGGGSDEK